MAVQNPFGLHTVTPYLIVDDVRALVRFLETVFDAVLRGQLRFREDGSVQHVEVAIGDSVIMMGEPTGDLYSMPAALYVYVDNCDRRMETALKAGGTTVLDSETYPHGDRFGGVRDPFGNIWWVVTHIGDELAEH